MFVALEAQFLTLSWTFGQDRRTWSELVDLLAKLRDDGCGVVTVTHDADFVEALADRTVTL